MKDVRKALKSQRLYFDGGFGTVVQAMGLKKGTPPETWNIEYPEKVSEVHRAYIDAGSNIITTNTFGVNCDKYPNYKELIFSAVQCARNAIGDGEEVFVAFDVGPTGRMLQPLGDLVFERAVEIFSESVREAVKCGVDLIIVETMNDSLETKAAVLAARENSDLPIFVTNVYDKSGKLMTGADPEAMIAMLEGLRVDALGMNCSFGPDAMLEIIDRFTENSSLPLITNPNAGLPRVEGERTTFDVTPDEFSDYMVLLAKKGVNILGGCCGTTPEHIRKTVEKTKDIPLAPAVKKDKTRVSSYTHCVTIGEGVCLIGERINPTGKPKLKDALRRGDMGYILSEGVREAECGVHILDVNVGLPEIDEASMMKRAVESLQAVTDLPLQLDSSNPRVLEGAMRIYNGKPLINSVNGKEESMTGIFPLIQKYGGAVIALTMDESGIPDTAEGRVAIAERIAFRALEYGIEKKDIIVDPLCLAVSSDPQSALVTLRAVHLLSQKGFRTSLGVSNVSFGLPEREKINTSFFTSALENGLDCAIMNPFSKGMMDVYYAFRALHGLDAGCTEYIEYAAAFSQSEAVRTDISSDITLHQAIVRGLRDEASKKADELLKALPPLDVINLHIVPALNEVGDSFEKKKTYLPQLLMSAESASAAFETVRAVMKGDSGDSSKAIILATVKGDIHDIGKNIVRVLAESYGYKVYDLGRDVDPERIVSAVAETGCTLVGLSALMTTTVPAMADTIKALGEKYDNVTTVVGGAVLTEEYASMIGADAYCADAMALVRFLENFYK